MHPAGAVAIILSTVLLYGAFSLVLSRLGQRLYASPSSLELAVVTILGAIVGRSILGQVPTLSGGLLALATLFLLESLAGRLRRTEGVRQRRGHRAVPLMVAGKIDRAELRRHGLDEAALWISLRAAGVTDPQQVAVAVLEPTGRISVLKGTALHPASLTGVRRANEVLAALDQAGRASAEDT